MTSMLATFGWLCAAHAAERAGTFPEYEQGWNVQKAHRPAIGGDAHPALLGGHSTADLRQLSGYDGLEVLNHRVPPATTQWDAALSSGRAVWAMANDDSSVDT
jgi:hypothetical protein